MLKTLSQKQKRALSWAFSPETCSKYKAIVCDGAVRSGKTTVLTLGFILWAMENFDRHNFAICGKTVGSTIRNVIKPLLVSDEINSLYSVDFKRSENLLIIRGKHSTNSFYIFGGKDESSQDLIQGITLAGIFFDEVALMPESFVSQGLARTLSISGAKYWFNCNPSNPLHWFKREWIDKADEKKALHLHFLMEDNPILTPDMIREAARSYSGMFYDRYILGLWVSAEGRVYDGFSPSRHILEQTPELDESEFYISCDYGTQNACVFLLWRRVRNSSIWYCEKEYYYSGREKQRQKTDQEYIQDLYEFTGGMKPKLIVVDPSAASFIAALKREGYNVKQAKNDVSNGIRNVATELKEGRLLFSPECVNTRKEFEAYVWDARAAARGEDTPLKENDHAMDAVRYFVRTVLYKKTITMNRGGDVRF